MAAPMPFNLAREINDRITEAWIIRAGIMRRRAPDLRGIRLRDALEAARIMRSYPGDPMPGGGRLIACVVAEDQIPKVFAWAITYAEGRDT